MPVDVKDLRAQYAGTVAQAEQLMSKQNGAELPKEVSDQIDALLGKSDELKVQIEQAERLAKANGFLDEGTGTDAAHLTWRKAGPNEGNVEVDEKEWQEYEVKDILGRSKKFRAFVPKSVQAKEYPVAFEAYLRKGMGDLGPNDKKTLLGSSDTAGGFTVPAEWQLELLKKVATNAVIRPLARRVQTSRSEVVFPRVNYSTDDKYTSGVRITWTGDAPASASTHRVTDPVFGQVRIPVHTAMASLPIGNDLMEDSVFDIAGYGSDLLAEAVALGEDDTFITGSGAGRPMGILTQVDGDGPASVVSGTSAQIYTAADSHNGYRMLGLYYALPAQYRRNAVFVLNSATMKEVESLVDAQKRPIISSLIAGSLALGQPDMIKGRPTNIDEFMPDIGASTFPILFGDMSGYTIVDRVGVSIQRLEEVYAELNLTVLLLRYRVGGYPTEPYRMKVMKCST